MNPCVTLLPLVGLGGIVCVRLRLAHGRRLLGRGFPVDKDRWTGRAHTSTG
ncbi:MAG: hypothetical protein ACPGMW_02375 [Poseidonia sp.]